MQRYKLAGDTLTLISTAETQGTEGTVTKATSRLGDRIKEAFIRRTLVTFTLENDNEEGIISEIFINEIPVYPN